MKQSPCIALHGFSEQVRERQGVRLVERVLKFGTAHSASISTKMLQELGGSTVIGPLLVGFDKSVQIMPMGSRDSDIVNMAAIAAYGISG